MTGVQRTATIDNDQQRIELILFEYANVKMKRFFCSSKLHTGENLVAWPNPEAIDTIIPTTGFDRNM